MNLEGRVVGLPAWAVLLALGAAGLGAYFLFFRGGGVSGPPTPTFGGTGTNPADYSASVGALENQVLGLGGQLNTISGQVDAGNQYGITSLAREQTLLENARIVEANQQLSNPGAIGPQG